MKADLSLGMDLPEGVWRWGMPVREMVVFSDRYGMSLSLLILDVPGVEHPDASERDLTDSPPSI